jgi:hypothetical protein
MDVPRELSLVLDCDGPLTPNAEERSEFVAHDVGDALVDIDVLANA